MSQDQTHFYKKQIELLSMQLDIYQQRINSTDAMLQELIREKSRIEQSINEYKGKLSNDNTGNNNVLAI